MQFSIIDFIITDNVAIITLNRPDKLNSFNQDMAMDVQTALDHCMDNPEVRAVLITGAGRGFCAGQDLAEAIAPGAADIEVLLRYTHPRRRDCVRQRPSRGSTCLKPRDTTC